MSYQLVRDLVSRETITALEQMLDGARSGAVIGIAFVLLLKKRRYLVNCAGEAARDPTLTRGCLCSLDDELSRMVQGKTDSSTTQ